MQGSSKRAKREREIGEREGEYNESMRFMKLKKKKKRIDNDIIGH